METPHDRRATGIRKGRRRSQQGSSLLLVMVTMSMISLVALASASLSLQGLATTRRSQDKLIAQTLAESGVDAALDALTSNYKSTSATGTLYEDAAKTIPIGTYTATITDVDVNLGQKKVISVGTCANGYRYTVIARITQGNLSLGKAALMSQGDISVGGTANIVTVPANLHTANIYSNGNVNLGGSGTDDGRLIAAGVVTGTAFYPSVSGAPRYPFPDSSTVSANMTTWYASSRSTNNIYNANNLFNGNKSTVTITAPAYISGNLNLQSSKTLILQGNGIIYLDGDLKLTSGAVLKNGSTFIVKGSFSQQGQSSYFIDSTATPAPTLAVATGDITLNAGSTEDAWGVVYAASGSIKVNGNATFTGALAAGGTGATITCTGTFTQKFPDVGSIISFPANPVVTQVAEP